MRGLFGHQGTITLRQRALLRWYRTHGRHTLPWRLTRDPYAILVSEVMLQQTQVDRVIPYWIAWMRRWPTIGALARAKRASVIRVWAGLGYNRRAVYLHRAAQGIVCDPVLQKLFSFSHELVIGFTRLPPLRVRGARGVTMRALITPFIPLTVRGKCALDIQTRRDWGSVLQRLPGVGPYTANALLAFAWNLPAPCVDTNVRRVLAHAIYRRPAIMRLPHRAIERLAARVIPNRRGRDWNYALMDYGALAFRARDISKCPKSDLGHLGRERRVEKFEGSARFWRGRIVAVLRDARTPLSFRRLRRELQRYGDPPVLRPLVGALVRDGVIRAVGGRHQLA